MFFGATLDNTPLKSRRPIKNKFNDLRHVYLIATCVEDVISRTQSSLVLKVNIHNTYWGGEVKKLVMLWTLGC
jgi:hypothetical protein